MCLSKRGGVLLYLCLGGWQSQENVCQLSWQQIHSSTEFQRYPVIHISCGIFVKVEGIRLCGGLWRVGMKNKQTEGKRRIALVNTSEGDFHACVVMICGCMHVYTCASHLASCDYWFSWSRFHHTTCWASAVWSTPWSRAGSSLSAPFRKKQKMNTLV